MNHETEKMVSGKETIVPGIIVGHPRDRPAIPMPRLFARRLLTTAFCLIPALAHGLEIRGVAYPPIADRAAAPEAFVPTGWRLEHLARGRLDADDREDALLVLRMDDPANVIDNTGFGPDRFDTNPRMLVALLAQPDGGWRQVMRDHRLVPRPESPVMDDFLGDAAGSAVTIRPNRTWSVALHSWASAGTWSMRQVAYTFRLEGDCMRLVGYDDMHLHRASGEITTTSVNYLTGRAWIQPGSISDDTPGAKRPTRLGSNAPLCIDDVGDGLAFSADLQEH
ncbi:hypothetical protein ACW5EG_14455 [Luteimonas sp. A611]